MNLSAHTGLGRHLDVRIPSNLLVVAFSVAGGAAALGATWLTGNRIDLPLAVAAGLSLFLAWAIARELDPDQNASAAIALGLAAIGLFLGSPAPGAAGVVLIAARIMAGTVGSRLRPGDLVVLVLVAGYAATRPEAWPAGLMLIAAVGVARPPHFKKLAAGMLAVGLVSAALTGTVPDFSLPSAPAIAVVAFTVIATVIGLRLGKVTSPTDSGVGTVSPRRVVAARVGVGLVVVAGGLLHPNGAVVLIPGAAALIGVAVSSFMSPSTGERPETTPVILKTVT
jgi:hypothetical protein